MTDFAAQRIANKMSREIYCDGASVPNPGFTACAVVSPGYGETVFELERGTSQTAELWALFHALETGQPGDVIFTDSQYAIGMIARGWKAKANVELVLQARKLYESKAGVSLEWIRGHNGHPHQERADKLANGAALAGFRASIPTFQELERLERQMWALKIKKQNQHERSDIPTR